MSCEMQEMCQERWQEYWIVQLTHGCSVDQDHDFGHPEELPGLCLGPDIVPPSVIGEEGGDSNQLC